MMEQDLAAARHGADDTHADLQATHSMAMEAMRLKLAAADAALELAERASADATVSAREQQQQAQIAKGELESRNRLLNETLGKVVEQHAAIERLSLQAVAWDANSYVPLPAPTLPAAVVAAEAALVAALRWEGDESAGESRVTMRNAQALLQQYAELHSLDMQRRSLLERAGELQGHLGEQAAGLERELHTLGELTAGADAAPSIRLKDDLYKVQESLATLTEKTQLWEAAEAARNDPAAAAAAAQWRSTTQTAAAVSWFPGCR